MSPTDLRVQFKLDTGEYPVWINGPAANRRTYLNGAKSWVCLSKPDKQSFRGKVKSIYGWWLEEKLKENLELLRRTFYKDQGVSATYPPPNRRSLFVGFRCSYTLWLEERYINKSK